MFIDNYYITEGERETEQERGRGRRGRGRGRRRNIFYLESKTQCVYNQGGEKKEHRVPIMMDCVQTTN